MRFSDEIEHRKAMIEMQGAVGCGSKPLRVSAATPKRYHTTLCYHAVFLLDPCDTIHKKLFHTDINKFICGSLRV